MTSSTLNRGRAHALPKRRTGLRREAPSAASREPNTATSSGNAPISPFAHVRCRCAPMAVLDQMRQLVDTLEMQGSSVVDVDVCNSPQSCSLANLA